MLGLLAEWLALVVVERNRDHAIDQSHGKRLQTPIGRRTHATAIAKPKLGTVPGTRRRAPLRSRAGGAGSSRLAKPRLSRGRESDSVLVRFDLCKDSTCIVRIVLHRVR